MTRPSRATLSMRMVMPLEALQKPAAAEDLVIDAVRTQRMPDGRDIDRNHRLAELQLEGRKDVLRRQVGAGLHDHVNVVALKLIEHHVDYLARRRVCDRGRGVAFEADHVADAIA